MIFIDIYNAAQLEKELPKRLRSGMSVSFSRCVLVGNSVLLSLPSRLDLEATVTGESIKHRPVTEIINLLKQML